MRSATPWVRRVPRLVGMLVDELERGGLRRGVAAVSGALGLGAAVVVESSRTGHEPDDRPAVRTTPAAAAACDRGLRDARVLQSVPETPDRYPDSAARLNAAGRLSRHNWVAHSNSTSRVRPGGSATKSLLTRASGSESITAADVDALFDAARRAMPAWRRRCAGASRRLLEIVQALFDEVPQLVPAVMHTAGQSPAMSYAGSGTNALDRGIEAIAYAHQAMTAVAGEALWERRFGAAAIRLQKRFRLVPRGVAVCFTCATFPTWNAFPALFASLATGNAVIVKPHPTGILPRHCRCAPPAACSPRPDSTEFVTLAVDSPRLRSACDS